MVEKGGKTHVVVEPRYVLAAALVSLPLTWQAAVGLAAVMSSWGVLVFTWTVIVPGLQIMSGVFFLPVLYMVWKALFQSETDRQEKLKAAHYGVFGLFIVNGAIIVSSVILLIATSIRKLGDDIKMLVHNYAQKAHDKELLDDIQMRFHCCGGTDVTNWFYNDWQNVDIEPGHVVDISSSGWDAVPFSCCSREVPPPCLHEGLKGFGLNSVYNTGCASALTVATAIFLAVSLVISLMAAIPLGWLMVNFKKDRGGNKKGKPGKPQPKKGSEKKLDAKKNKNSQEKTPRSQKKAPKNKGTEKKRVQAKPSSSRGKRRHDNVETEGSGSSGSFDEINLSTDSDTGSEEQVPISEHGDFRRTLSDPAISNLNLNAPEPQAHVLYPTTSEQKF